MTARFLLALAAPLALAGCLQFDDFGSSNASWGSPIEYGSSSAVAMPGFGRPPRANRDDQLERGTRACVAAARQDGYRVERIRDAGRSGKNNVDVTLKTRRKGRTVNLDCTYDGGRGKVRLRD